MSNIINVPKQMPAGNPYEGDRYCKQEDAAAIPYDDCTSVILVKGKLIVYSNIS